MKTFSVTPGSELDRVLDEAASEPVLIERRGARFRLSREPDEDIWTGYDPEVVRLHSRCRAGYPPRRRNICHSTADTMKTFTATPGSDLDRVIDEASAGPVFVKRDGSVYRVTVEREEIPWEEYQPDPDAVRAALAETVGSWSDLNTDAMIANIYRWREDGSRSPDRP